MMKYFFKKNIIAIIIAVALLGITFGSTLLSELVYDDSTLQGEYYKIEATLTDSGDLSVVEKIKMKSEQGMSVVFRDIAYDKDNLGSSTNSAYFQEDSVNVKVYDKNESLIYDYENSNSFSGVQVGFSWENDRDELGELIRCPASYQGECESIFTRVIAGTYPYTTYEYSYTIKGAATKFNDVTELNWIFVDDMGIKIKDIDVTLNFPNATNIDDVLFYGHGSTNATVDSISSNVIKFSTSIIKPGEVLEARLVLPSNLFSNVSSNNTINRDYLEEMIQKESAIEKEDIFYYNTNIVVIIITLLIVIVSGLIFAFIYKKYDKEYKSDFYSEYYRELPAEYSPAEMSYLYNFRDVTKNDLTATLLDLIRRKYILIDYEGESTISKKANYKLILDTTKDSSSLLRHEKFLIEWFFKLMSKDKKTLSLKEIEQFPKQTSNAEAYMSYNNRWISYAKSEGSKHDFFDKVSERVLHKYFFIPLILIIYGFIALFLSIGGTLPLRFLPFSFAISLATAIVMISYFVNIKRRSKQGNEEYVRWNAFKNFLKEFGRFEDYSMPSIAIWEHYLVYATSFGIADLVEKQMRMKFKQMNLNDDTVNSVPLFRYPMFNYYIGMRMMRSFTIATTTINTARAQAVGRAAGKGGLGGFGGGRSFGGGGGGFRGR